MTNKDQKHIVVVEAYDGFIEFLSDESEERRAARGLGLPLEEIAENLDCRITVLCWDEWFRYEVKENWLQRSATRPVSQPDLGGSSIVFDSNRVKQVSIPTRDPEYWLPFDEKGLSPHSHGIINDSGLLFFASYSLNKELRAFYEADPFQAIILPMWGGLGYVAQMAKATHAPNLVDVPFAIVVTDISRHRQIANQEGVWTRQAIVRRQMEDISLALADLVLVFGPRGTEIATAGRLPRAAPPVCVPRFVEETLLDRIAAASNQPAKARESIDFFLYEPQQAAAGVLATLDAVRLLEKKGVHLDRPVISAGPSMTFAPMKPREFENYWSSRGFVRELICESRWAWMREYPRSDDVFPIRVYPSFFEHLPNIWSELARGSLVLVSPAAAEGLAPGEMLPQEILIHGEPIASQVADCLGTLASIDVSKLDQIRQELCKRVVAAHRGEARRHRFAETTRALEQLLLFPPKSQDLGQAALMCFDRRVPLRTLAEQDTPPAVPAPRPGTKKGALSVVVTCYQMGSMIKEALASVWAADHQPDEVLLIDDGSYGEQTLAAIEELEQDAARRALPLRVIRQRNKGLAEARNVGLEAANGEFISFLDGDDLIEPAFYRTALRLLTEYPRLGGVASWALCFGTDVVEGYWNAPQTEFPFLFVENSVIIPCVTRTEMLRSLGGYDVGQRYNYEDWELSIRMLTSGWPIVTIPMHLMKYRIRKDSLFRSMTDVQNQVMRELLFANHQAVVSKFALEITMQVEHRLAKLAYPDLESKPNASACSAFPKLSWLARPQSRLLHKAYPLKLIAMLFSLMRRIHT